MLRRATFLRQTTFTEAKIKNVLNDASINKERGKYIGLFTRKKEEFDKIGLDHYSAIDSIYRIYENTIDVYHIGVNQPYFSIKNNEVELYPKNYSLFTIFDIPKVSIPLPISKVESELDDIKIPYTHFLHSAPHLVG